MSKQIWSVVKPQTKVTGRDAIIMLRRKDHIVDELGQHMATSRQRCVEAFEAFAETEVVKTAKNCAEALAAAEVEMAEAIVYRDDCIERHETAVRTGDIAKAANAVGERTSAESRISEHEAEIKTLRRLAIDSHDAAATAFKAASESISDEIFRNGIAERDLVFMELVEAIQPLIEKLAIAQAMTNNSYRLMDSPSSMATIEKLLGKSPIKMRQPPQTQPA